MQRLLLLLDDAATTRRCSRRSALAYSVLSPSFPAKERTFPPSYTQALSCHPSPSDARTLLPCCLHPSCVLLSVFSGAASLVSLSLSLSLSDGESSNNSDSEAEEDVGVDDMQTFEPGALPAAKAADKEEMEEEEGGGGTGGSLGGTGGTANSTSAQDKESSSDEFEDDDMDKY